MKQPVFEGTCTALITPFAENQINYELFDTLLARQIQAGVSAVAVCATTGEAATMSDREQTALIAHCVTARPNSLPAASVSVKLRVESTRPYSLIHVAIV